MLTPDFFIELGLFVSRDFFKERLRHKLIEEMKSAARRPGDVYQGGAGVVINQEARKVSSVEVSNYTVRDVNHRLEAITGQLESHFATKISSCKTDFLLYEEGDFFLPHQDFSDSTDFSELGSVSEEIKRRKVVTSIFLNAESDKPEPDSYSGGSLVLYGLVKDPLWANYGFPLPGEPGLLVAFPPETYHEVRPVTRGQRYSVVSIFSF